MADVTENEARISIKVVVDREKNKVAYAEADHNFVDILFSFMTWPLGTIVTVLGKHDDKKFAAFGSLNNLLQSLVDLPECYMATEECKSMLLSLKSSSFDLCQKLKLKIDVTEPTKYFVCENRGCTVKYRIFSTSNLARCSYCGRLMDREICFKDSTVCGDDDRLGGGGGVFVSETSTFIVTDDLCVMPYTPGRCIQLLIDFGITDLSHLEERTVDIGREQMLDLLNFALSFNSPLTHIVLHTTCFPKDLEHSVQGKCEIIKTQGSTSSKIFLEVSLQKSSGKLLFAEAEEDFVDFVFGFLVFPMGGVINKLKNGTSLICMENIYKSISNMSEGRYLKSYDIKRGLLLPSCDPEYFSRDHILKGVNWTALPEMHIGYSSSSLPPDWWSGCFLTTKPTQYGLANLKDPRASGSRKLLRQSGMFLVTDDLAITPSSSVSTMDILKKLKVPLHDIERHKVGIGMEEALSMLKASLSSSSALTKGLENQLKNLKK